MCPLGWAGILSYLLARSTPCDLAMVTRGLALVQQALPLPPNPTWFILPVQANKTNPLQLSLSLSLSLFLCYWPRDRDPPLSTNILKIDSRDGAFFFFFFFFFFFACGATAKVGEEGGRLDRLGDLGRTSATGLQSCVTDLSD